MCKKSGATLVAIFETAMDAQAQGITVEPMSIGGAIELDGLVVNMVMTATAARVAHVDTEYAPYEGIEEEVAVGTV